MIRQSQCGALCATWISHRQIPTSCFWDGDGDGDGGDTRHLKRLRVRQLTYFALIQLPRHRETS